LRWAGPARREQDAEITIFQRPAKQPDIFDSEHDPVARTRFSPTRAFSRPAHPLDARPEPAYLSF